MTIQLTKDNSESPDVYSSGDGSDPVSVSLTLDGSGAPASVTASPATSVYVWANDNTTNIDNYSDIDVTIVGSDTGITWELSADGATGWASTIALSNLDVSATHQATQIYVRASALNDGTVATANYTGVDIQITATENPA
jgi:hypothetical protein